MGAQAHFPQPETVNDFIPILAGQLKKYNEIAASLWPANALVNQSIIAEDIKNKKLWLIATDGAITPISKKEAESYGFKRQAYVNGFAPFNGGVYLAISEKSLTNYLLWQHYLHFGTYDAFLFFTHEGFHMLEQPKWRNMDSIPNSGRSKFLEKTPERTKRALLEKQLLKAVSSYGSTQLILEALATYADWKTLFPDDYKNSIYFERVEGTANYFEFITGLYCGYPDQIKNRDDLERSLALLATREDIYVRYGLINESYIVSGFSCVLLDRLESDWKERLINDPQATPIEMLYQHFKDETLPAPRQITQAEIDAAEQEIKKPAGNRMPLLFEFFYDILYS